MINLWALPRGWLSSLPRGNVPIEAKSPLLKGGLFAVLSPSPRGLHQLAPQGSLGDDLLAAVDVDDVSRHPGRAGLRQGGDR